jgi:hypothetical protein
MQACTSNISDPTNKEGNLPCKAFLADTSKTPFKILTQCIWRAGIWKKALVNIFASRIGIKLAETILARAEGDAVGINLTV